MFGFLVGHATHPDWRAALALAGAQIEARLPAHESSGAGPLTLGFVYFTDHYAPHAQALLAELRVRWPGVAWVGSVGVGVCASGVEYIDEPALVLMLAALPAGRFEVFSGARKLQRITPYTALVHADPATPDLQDLITEMSDRTESGYLFGGLASSRATTVHLADGVWQGGLSGVAFSREVALVSRVTQGSQPIGPTREVTACERNIVTELDGEPALPCLLRDLGLPTLEDPRAALPRLRATLVGLTDATDTALVRPGQFGTDTRVRHLVGLDPGRQAVAVADLLEPGMRLAFCQRDVQAARRDLVRICSEIRDELETQAEATLAASDRAQGPPAARRIQGALYVSCTGRGGPHFGGPSAELKIIQHALGGGADEDIPLVGFFAAGEIARHHLYGYTGVLTVFTGEA
ncbi:MAG: FIST C-terminal domain-containing protein [Rubrivivax sp.]|nr:FIST C-terminal domain-containing protein [Rubrivivax sp.]